MSFTFAFSVVLSSDNFSDVGLYNGTTPVINTVYSGVWDGGATFFSFLFWGPIDNVIAFFESRDGVTFRNGTFVFLPGGTGFGHGLFAGDPVFLGIIGDELVPIFGHSFFVFNAIKTTKCQQEDGLHM